MTFDTLDAADEHMRANDSKVARQFSRESRPSDGQLNQRLLLRLMKKLGVSSSMELMRFAVTLHRELSPDQHASPPQLVG
jgi:hypothetical protein